MKKLNEVSLLPEFDKDIKKLLKRFKTLENDLDIFIESELYLYHKLNVDNKGIFQIPNLHIDEPKIYKAKKFACRSLKGRGSRSGIRVIYAYFAKEDKIELIEIYYNGDKIKEDRKKILKHYKSKGRQDIAEDLTPRLSYQSHFLSWQKIILVYNLILNNKKIW